MITSAYNEKILIKVINQQATGISLINSYAEFLNRCKTANLFSMQFAGFEPFFFSDINNCNTASPTLLTELNNWYFEWMMFCQFREDRNNDFIEKKKNKQKKAKFHISNLQWIVQTYLCPKLISILVSLLVMTVPCRNNDQQCQKHLNVLRKLKFKISRHNLEKLHLAFIRPLFEYVCEV